MIRRLSTIGLVMTMSAAFAAPLWSAPPESAPARPTEPAKVNERAAGRPDRERGDRPDPNAAGTQRGARDSARETSDRSGMTGRHHHRRSLTPADLDRIIEIARQIDPERGEQWSKDRSDNSAAFERALMLRGKLMFGLLELETRHPALFEVRICELRAQARSKRLADEWSQATQAGSLAGAQAIEDEVRAAVREQLECGQQARAHEIVILHEHQKKLREKLQHSLANSDAIVEQRLREIMAQAQAREANRAATRPALPDHRWDGETEPDSE